MSNIVEMPFRRPLRATTGKREALVLSRTKIHQITPLVGALLNLWWRCWRKVFTALRKWFWAGRSRYLVFPRKHRSKVARSIVGIAGSSACWVDPNLCCHDGVYIRELLLFMKKIWSLVHSFDQRVCAVIANGGVVNIYDRFPFCFAYASFVSSWRGQNDFRFSLETMRSFSKLTKAFCCEDMKSPRKRQRHGGIFSKHQFYHRIKCCRDVNFSSIGSVKHLSKRIRISLAEVSKDNFCHLYANLP